MQKGLLHFFLNRDIANFNPRVFEFAKNAGSIRSESNNPISQFFFNFIETGRFEIDDDEDGEYYPPLKDLKFNPTDLHSYYVIYHKKYCPRIPLYNLSGFRKTFAELFLGGSQSTKVQRVNKSKPSRIWELECRLHLAAKYGLNQDSLD